MSKFFPLKLRGISSFHVAYLSVLWLMFIASNHINAQDVPKAINYQAIVRDSETMLPISDQGAYISVEFLDGPNGDILYQEEFYSIRTGISGLINLSLGQGDPVINTFENVSWETGNVWLRISVDVGSGLNMLQEIPFNTVPYAFYAQDSGGSDDDNDPTNELIQSISLDESDLEITEGGETTTIDLSSLINDNDSDPTNERIDSLRYNAVEGILSVFESGSQFDVDLGLEQGTIQDLSYDEDGHTLSITDNEEATTVNLTPYLDNTDAQTLSLDGTVLELSGSESSVDLTDLLNTDVDLDPNPLNEIQDLILSNDSLLISRDGDGVDLSGFLDNTDNQALALTDSILSLSGDVPTSVNLASILEFAEDGDNDDSNEIQDISTNNSPGNISITDGSSLTINVEDGDADDSNEIQDLSLSGNTLSLTGDGTAVDLSGYLDNTDNQELSLSGNTLSLSGDGSTVDLSPYDNSDLSQNHIFLGDAAGEAQEVQVTGDVNIASDGNITVTGIQSVDVSSAAPTDGQVLVYDGGTGEWIPAAPPSVTPSTETHYYSVDPLDFRQLVDNNIGVPFDTENTLVFFDDEAPFAMLRDDNGLREIMAPIHLPQGAEINNLKVYFRDSGPGVMWIRLYRKNLTDYSLSNEFLISEVAGGPPGDRVLDEDITNFNLVDNSTYVYRLYVRFTAFENNDNEGDADEIEQRVYGAVVEYTTD